MEYAKVKLPQNFNHLLFVGNPALRRQTAADINPIAGCIARPGRVEFDQKVSHLPDQLLVVMSRRRRPQRHNEFLAEEDFARVDVLYAPDDEGLQRCLHEFQYTSSLPVVPVRWKGKRFRQHFPSLKEYAFSAYSHVMEFEQFGLRNHPLQFVTE